MNWRTKYGKEIPIEQLSTAHLHNIVQMFLREADMYRWQILGEAYAFQGSCRGDGAFDAAEYCIANLEAQSDEALLQQNILLFAAVYKEYKSRKELRT